MALDAANAVLADRAVALVRDAVTKAEKAINGRWQVLVWVTGSQSTAAAEDEDLRQSRKALDLLTAQRPTLDNDGVPAFLDLAAAAADVSQLQAAAHLQSGAGFKEQVIEPTVATVKDGAGLAAIGGGALLAVVAVVAAAVLVLRFDRG